MRSWDEETADLVEEGGDRFVSRRFEPDLRDVGDDDDDDGDDDDGDGDDGDGDGKG